MKAARIADTLTNVVPNKIQLTNLSGGPTKLVIHLDENEDMLQDFVCRLEFESHGRKYNMLIDRDAMIQAMKTKPMEAYTVEKTIYNLDTHKVETIQLGAVNG